MNRREFTKGLSCIGIVGVLIPNVGLDESRLARPRQGSSEMEALDYVLLDLDKLQFTRIDAGGKDNMELYIDFFVPGDSPALEQALRKSLAAWAENYCIPAKVIGQGFPSNGIKAMIEKWTMEFAGVSDVITGQTRPTILGLTLLYEGEWHD